MRKIELTGKFFFVCDTGTFTLNDAQDYAICETWRKVLKIGKILQFEKFKKYTYSKEQQRG
jgi:hypothetical protein